jgi:hypothetical protein
MDQQVKEAGGEAKNLAFHRDAIVLASRPLPPVPDGMGAKSAVMNEDGIAVRVIWAYNANYLGVQVTMDVLYGVAELRDNHAVVIRSTLV